MESSLRIARSGSVHIIVGRDGMPQRLSAPTDTSYHPLHLSTIPRNDHHDWQNSFYNSSSFHRSALEGGLHHDGPSRYAPSAAVPLPHGFMTPLRDTLPLRQTATNNAHGNYQRPAYGMPRDTFDESRRAEALASRGEQFAESAKFADSTATKPQQQQAISDARQRAEDLIAQARAKMMSKTRVVPLNGRTEAPPESFSGDESVYSFGEDLSSPPLPSHGLSSPHHTSHALSSLHHSSQGAPSPAHGGNGKKLAVAVPRDSETASSLDVAENRGLLSKQDLLGDRAPLTATSDRELLGDGVGMQAHVHKLSNGALQSGPQSVSTHPNRVDQHSNRAGHQVLPHAHVQTLLAELRQVNEELALLKEEHDSCKVAVAQANHLLAEEKQAHQHAVDQLQTEAQRSIATFEEERKLYEQALTHFEEQIDSFIQQQSEMKETLQSDFRSQLSAVEARHADVLRESSSRLQQAHLNCAQLEGSLSKLTEEVASLKELNQQLLSDRDALREKFQATEKQLSLFQDSSSAVQSAMTVSSASILTSHAADMEALRASLTAAHASALDEIKAHFTSVLKTTKENAQFELAECANKFRRLEDAHVNVIKDRDAARRQVQELQAEMADQQTRIAELEASYDFRDQRAHAAGYAEAMREAEDKFEQVRLRYASEVDSLRTKLSEIDNESESAHAALKRQVLDLTKQLGEAEACSRSQAALMQNHHQFAQQREQQLSEALESAATLQKEKQVLQDAQTTLQNQLADFQLELQSKAAEVLSLTEEAAATKRALEDREREIARLTESVNGLQCTVADLNGKYAELEAVHAELRGTVGTATAEKLVAEDSTRQKVQELNRQLETQATSLHKLSDDLTDALESKKQIQQLLNAERIRSADMQHRLDGHSQNEQHFKTMSELLQEELSVVREKLSILETCKMGLDAEVESLKVQVHAFRGVQSAEQELSEQLAVAIADNEQKSDLVQALMKEIDALKQLACDQAELLDAAGTTTQRLQTQMETTYGELLALRNAQGQVAQMEARVQTLEGELQTSKQSYQTAHFQWLQKERGYFETINQQHKEADEQKAQLLEQLRAANTNLAQMHNSVEMLCSEKTLAQSEARASAEREQALRISLAELREELSTMESRIVEAESAASAAMQESVHMRSMVANRADASPGPGFNAGPSSHAIASHSKFAEGLRVVADDIRSKYETEMIMEGAEQPAYSCTADANQVRPARPTPRALPTTPGLSTQADSDRARLTERINRHLRFRQSPTESAFNRLRPQS